MEKVFWLMWMADAVGNIRVFGGLLLFLAMAGIPTLWIIDGSFKRLEPLARTWTICLVVLAALQLTLPRERTIQLLAISSASEAAANTALGAKGIEALNAVLDKVIENAKK